jgi:hypothetical protein
MATSEEFGEFAVSVERRPEPGAVSVGKIPEPLAELLAEHAPKALADTNYELSLVAKDAATAKKLALYARAWGAQQDPKLYIHKLPNRRDMKDNVARLAVEKDEDVPAENRPGRKTPARRK